MIGDITRLQELRTMATHRCMDALVGVQQNIYNHDAVKTNLEVTETRTDDEPGNMIIQESVWTDLDGSKWVYRLLIAVMVERERVVPEVPASARSRAPVDPHSGEVLPISEESAVALGLDE